MQVVESKSDSEVIHRPTQCTICSHPDRDIIDGLLAAGTASRRTIASRYGLTDGSVQRHKTNHIGKRIVAAVERKQAKSEDVFLDRLEHLWNECADGVAKAKDGARVVRDLEGNLRYVGRDLSALAPLLGQAHRNLELLGTATGRLNQVAGPSTVHLSVIMPRVEVASGPNQVEPGQIIDVEKQIP